MKTNNDDIEEGPMDFAVDSDTMIEDLPNSKSVIHVGSSLFLIKKT